ncbi:MAG: hypothetical protein AAF615_00030 [Pseudomonadota bacterium]
MSRIIAAVDAGTYYHHESLYGERFKGAFDEIVYARTLADADLRHIDILLVTCRTDPAVLLPAAPNLLNFLEGGGTLVAMGSTGPHLWLPGVSWTDTPTNFWWWREGGELGLKAAAPDDPFFAHVPFEDAIWHHHGAFAPPPGALSLIDAKGLGSVLYLDRQTMAPGTLLVTALDPFYHHGSHFMPATTRFIAGFLPFLRQDPRLKRRVA